MKQPVRKKSGESIYQSLEVNSIGKQMAERSEGIQLKDFKA
jgi:hypothetical protein